MIRVSLATLVFIYLGIFLVTVFSAWIARNIQRLRREKEALRHRVRCAQCAFEFEDKTGALLPRCPRCGSLNERARLKPL